MNNLPRNFVLVLILATLAGCDQARNQQREKYLTCYNAYVTQRNAAMPFWNNYLKAATPQDKLAQLKQCRSAWERVEPYQPLGVDPRLADAIRDLKAAWIEYLDFTSQQTGAWLPNIYRANQLIDAVNEAERRLESANNRVAADIGDVAALKPS